MADHRQKAPRRNPAVEAQMLATFSARTASPGSALSAMTWREVTMLIEYRLRVLRKPLLYPSELWGQTATRCSAKPKEARPAPHRACEKTSHRLVDVPHVLGIHPASMHGQLGECGFELAEIRRREYKRLFGEPPLRDVERLRG
jgi:hypothetical protein